MLRRSGQQRRNSVLSSQFSVLSSQFSVLSSQFSVLSSQFSVLSSQFSVLSSQFSVLSSQFSENSTTEVGRRMQHSADWPRRVNPAGNSHPVFLRTENRELRTKKR